MQWREDRDDELIEMTARLFEGKPGRFRTDWPAIVATAVWLAMVVAAAIFVR